MTKTLSILLLFAFALVFSACELSSEVITWTAVADADFDWDWGNYSAAAYPVAYCRDSMGQVHIRGAVEDTVPASAETGTKAIFIIPQEYRPVINVYFAITIYTGSNYEGARLVVFPSGSVSVIPYDLSSTIRRIYIGEVVYNQ